MTTLMNQLQARIETAVNKTGTYNEALQNLANLYGVPQGETGSRLIPVVQVFDPTINNATAAQNYLLYNSTIVSGGVPSLGLDFTSGTLDSRVTFTRASTATRVNAAGLIESVAINGPRFDYDPVTLAPKGLLIEEQRTNLLTYSEDFSNAIWSKSAGATIGSNAVVAPDGNTTADNVTLAASGDHVYQTYTATYSAGAAYTFSMYVKSANRAITWGGATPAGTDVYASTNVGNGWYRQSLTRTFTGAGTGVSIQTMLLGSQPAGLGPYAVWGAQLEAGSFATSYIPTVAAQVTRSADNASMIGDNFSSWFVENSGSIFFELSRPLSGIRTPLQFGSSGANRYGPFFSSTFLQYFDGTSKNVGGNSNAGYTKIAGSVTNNDIAFSQDGGAAVAVPTGVTKSGVNTFTIGAGHGFIANEMLNGHIRRIMYYQTRLTNAQLQALTS